MSLVCIRSDTRDGSQYLKHGSVPMAMEGAFMHIAFDRLLRIERRQCAVTMEAVGQPIGLPVVVDIDWWQSSPILYGLDVFFDGGLI